MGNLVKRFLFENTLNIGKYERYFQNMADQGLYLKSINRTFAVFEKRWGEKLKYRIDVSKEKPSESKLDEYKNRGFNYAAGKENFHVFSSLENNNKQELYENPLKQSYIFLKLEKSLKTGLIFEIIITIFTLGIMSDTLFYDNKIYMDGVKGQLTPYLILLIVIFHIIFKEMPSYFYFHKKRKALEKGKWINHKENWKRSRCINGVINILLISFVLILVVNLIISSVKNKDYPLPEVKTKLPIVRLMEIEKNPDMERQESVNNNGVDFADRITYGWSFLAPYQFHTEEHGKIYDAARKNKSVIYTQYYQLTFEKMGEGLIQDLINENVYNNAEIQKINNPSFDLISIVEDGEEKQIFAKFRNSVIYIRYYGNKQSKDIIPLIKDNIK